MRYLILLVLIFSNDPKEISKINKLKEQAEQAYLTANYEVAKSTYHTLIDSMKVEDAKVKLNLAHAYYQLGDTASAKTYYNGLNASPEKELKSIALQQLGVMSKDEGKLEQALQQLKTAIKTDPTNAGARYDYEVVKKQLEEQKKQEQENQDQENQDQNKDGEDDKEKQDQENEEKGDQENEEQKDGEKQEKSEDEQKKEDQQQNEEEKDGEQSEEEKEQSQEEMTKEKLEEMGITEEKAKQLLEAMRQNEIKYLQYQKRKATKRPPSGKPDW